MEVLDCLGKRCPLPVIELAKVLKSKPVNAEVRLLSDDPASAPDLIAWARMTGNSVKEVGDSAFEVTKLTD
jgi:tRNA 2-thiouridine synthesizing protein A